MSITRASAVTQQLVAWQTTPLDFARERSVVELFRERVRTQPGALALTDGARLFDYATLDRLSNRVAQDLLGRGLAPEDVVALALERSCAYVIAALGVLKAGGSYLPLDVHVPDRRLWELLNDSGAKWVFTAPDDALRVESLGVETRVLDNDAALLADAGEAAPAVPDDPARRAYVIYTSGSTGRPKGVEIEHHSLTNLVAVYHRCFGLGPGDRVPLVANVAFDAAVADLWPCLTAGGTVLVPAPELLLELDQFIQWLAANAVTVALIPTGLAEVLLTREWPAQMPLRILGVGGDVLHLPPRPGLPFTLINQYGPTENTVDSVWAVVPPAADLSLPPIGFPIGNVTARVLDDHGQPVRPGEEGELFLGGEQVARGYLNLPALTAERFVPDPCAGRPGARLYRTGDWVRQRADGQLEFVGRRDAQVQLHGRRVELGEIEAALHQHPAVRHACVEPMLKDGAVTGLVAHIVPAADQLRLADLLRGHLTAQLPAWMVPGGFVLHDRLPLTARGKVDRAALRAAVPMPAGGLTESFPEGSPGRAIAQLWFSLLPQAEPGQYLASLDALGGDSLHAVKVLLGVEKIVGRRLLMSDFMRDPTLPGLLRLALGAVPDNQLPLISLRAGGTRPPVFCLYGVQGDVYHYLELANALGADQPVFGLRSLALADMSRLPNSMAEAGERALQQIRAQHTGGRLVLTGYSWGGTLAFEVARQWVAAGGAAPLLILIGANAPRRRTSSAYRLWHFVRWFPAWVRLKFREGSGRSPRQMWQRFLAFCRRDPAEAPAPVPDAEWAQHPIAQHLMGIEDRYHPAGGPELEVHLIRETECEVEYFAHPLDSSDTAHLKDLGWSRWTGRRVRLHWIEAGHDTILRPPVVRALAQKIRELMDAG